jgi:hypothetical protein
LDVEAEHGNPPPAEKTFHFLQSRRTSFGEPANLWTWRPLYFFTPSHFKLLPKTLQQCEDEETKVESNYTCIFYISQNISDFSRH